MATDRSLTSSILATLSDGRLQAFTRSGGVVRTCWQTSTDPAAPWSPWSVLDGFGGWDVSHGELFGTLLRADGLTAVYGSTSEDRRSSSGFVIGAGLWLARKRTADPNSGWRIMIPYPGFVLRGRRHPHLRTQTVTAAAAFSLPDGREQLIVQAYFADDPPRLLTRHAPTSGADTFLGAESPFEPAPGVTFVSLHAGSLADGRPQLFGVTGDRRILSCWRTGRGVNDSWSGWSEFPAPPWPVQAIAPPRLSPVRRRGGVLQLFTCAGGSAYLCEKLSADVDAGWSGWRALALPALAEERVLVDVAAAVAADDSLHLLATRRHIGRRPMERLYLTREIGGRAENWAPWTHFLPDDAAG